VLSLLIIREEIGIMDISIFQDKANKPDEQQLIACLGDTYTFWMQLHDYVLEKYPNAIEEWNFPGKKFGWSFRMKDKKRAILYLLPRAKFFKVAFVFGQKALDQILESEISDGIKENLVRARVYAEGRGIRIDVADAARLMDIKKLIVIKLAN